MIRISFETQTDSKDPVAPNAWRREASARLREIAKRIAVGEAMPLILLNSEGNFVGKAREISNRPEPARQSHPVSPADAKPFAPQEPNLDVAPRHLKMRL